MHTLGDIYGQFMLRLCLWCLGSIAAGVAFCVLASIAKRYAKLVRRVGLFAAILLSTFIFGMIREGVTTQEDKDDYRNAMEPLMEERAAIARILLPSDGDLSKSDSCLAEMNADPPRSAPETTWQSFDCWNHGIYMGGERVDFAPGWVFPYGSNHLSSVEVMAWGEILSNSRSLAPIASLGRRLSLLPDVSSFQYGLTPSNTYTFAWNGARDGRISGEPFDGIIELFRHGDISVTTNGVTEVYPRILPFSHDGFGQDDEWVAANFTNATEIIAMGYPQWVDAQVGEGLTNGYFKFTATFPDDPPETVQLLVGDYSLAVANAGDYVFLLEKGVEYEYGTVPFLTNVVYSAVDDVPQMRGVMRAMRDFETPDDTRRWTEDGGYGNEAQTDMSLGRVWWLPVFFGYPDIVHIGLENNPMTFGAAISDYRGDGSIQFLWTASDGLTIASPNSQTTLVNVVDMPSWAEAQLSVTASIGGKTLESHLEGLTCGTNDIPQVHLRLSLPRAILLNSNEVSAAKIADAGWTFSSDAPTSGTVRVYCVANAEKVVATGFVGEWHVEDMATVSGTVEGTGPSETIGDVAFRMEFFADAGTNAVGRGLTVIRVGNVQLPSAPVDGLIVLTNTPVAMQVECEPQGAGSFLDTTWHTRRLKSDGSFEEWQLVSYAHHGSSFSYTPSLGGIYQVRALASVEAGGVDERTYVWDIDESDDIGYRRIGDDKEFGVCDAQWQIDLCECAKGFLGSTAYLELTAVPAQYGFSASPGRSDAYKCNLFVAHRAVQSGLAVPANHGLLWRAHPPLANEWGDRQFEIEGWACVSTDAPPQPGYVSSDPATGGVPGHVGILDFDGCGISAGMANVNRFFNACNNETVLRKYTRNQR